jgi:hypothetical protein
MRFVRTKTSLTIVALVASLAMFAISRDQWRETGALVVDESTCDLGRVWSGSRLQWRVRVNNPTNREFVITDVQTSCVCAAAQSIGLVIPSGQTVEIPIEINTGAGTNGGEKYEQPFSSRLSIYFGQWLKPLVVQLHGTVLTPAVVDWDTVRFGRVYEEDKSKSIQVVTLTPLTSISEVKLGASATADGRYILRHGSLQQASHPVPIEISLGYALSPGIIDDRVRLICAVDSERYVKGDPFSIELRVTGELVGDLTSDLSKIDFGLFRGPGTVTREVVFFSRSDRKFRLDFEGEHSPGVSASNPLDQLASSHTVGLIIDCTSPGAVKRSAGFSAIYEDGSRRRVDVPVTGYVTFTSPVPLSDSLVKLSMP